ncbi:MAG: hypothetical protein ACP5N3_04210 [Candidatus Nanoarchaeia archaeon]
MEAKNNMLLEWFIVLLSLCIALIVISYIFKIPPLAVGGFTLLFLLGNIVMFSNLDVKSGYNEYELAPCNSTCTEIRAGGNVSSFLVTNTTITFNYSPIVDEEIIGIGLNHLLGFFLALIGVFGFIDIFANLKGLK